MHRDPNGFRKLIVALSPSAGKAFALHNGDGRVIWSTAFDPSAPPTHLLRWRRFHDLTHAPLLALARAGGAGAFVSVVDGGTGREKERIELPYAVDRVGGGFCWVWGSAAGSRVATPQRQLSLLTPNNRHCSLLKLNQTKPTKTPSLLRQIVPLPQPLHDGTAEQFTYALISPPSVPAPGAAPPPALPAHLLPDSPEARAHLAAAAPSFVFWGLHPAPQPGESGAARALAGYAFELAAATAGGAGLEARLAWSVQVAGELLAVAARDPEEPMHTAVKVGYIEPCWLVCPCSTCHKHGALA
jgi:hypothetical protein